MNGVKIKTFFEQNFPTELAYEWDNVGLQIGTLNKTLTGILIALDVTKDVVTEAIKKNVNLIIVHHPLFFKPVLNILSDSYRGALVEKLIKNDIALYVAHTNYDVAEAGMNAVLAEKIGLENTDILDYESSSHGIGRIGRFKETSLFDTVRIIKDRLGIDHARLITNRPDKRVSTIAISGGSGASHMFAAKRKGADLYITGDVSYHQAHDMLQLGLTGLDIGHHAEQHFAKALKAALVEIAEDCPVYESNVDLDPFTFV